MALQRPAGLLCLLLVLFGLGVETCQAGSVGSASSPMLASSTAGIGADALNNTDISARRYMTLLDWAVIAVYMLGMLGIGAYYHFRMHDAEDYLLGGRNMRSSSVGLSLFATLFSTITYLALPGEIIDKGPVILWSMAAIPIAYVIVGYSLIPHFMRLRMTSAYEILEKRLGLNIRLMGSTIFLLTRMFWMALIIYITSQKIIVVMMGLPDSWTPWVALVIGLVTVVYTSMGGLRAVVLTDVIQSFILLGGALLAIGTVTYAMGGVGAWWPTSWSPTWDSQPVWPSNETTWFDMSQRATVIGSIVFMTVWWICTAGSDQMAIQRYFATRDVKAARRVFLITGLTNIVVTCLLACVGFGLLAFFSKNPQLLQSGMDINTKDTADIAFPYYIIRFIPPGVTGLVISGLLAAAMSSLSAGINSACSVLASDYVDRFWIDKGQDTARAQIRRTRIISVVVGIIAVLLSSLMGNVTGNIMEVTVRTNHVFVAPLFGLFFMAMFVPFATAAGTAIGAIAGCGIAVVIAYWDFLTGNPSLSFQWISLISLVVDLGVAIPLSYVLSGGRRMPSFASENDLSNNGR